MEPLIITVAGIGAELTREDQPNLPLTPAEIAEDAVACESAGASIYHLHVRDQGGEPTMNVQVYSAALGALRASTNLIVQFSSGGAVTDTEIDRIAPLDLRPEMASLTTGSVNFGDEIFANPYPLVERFYVRMRELQILPEFEIFEPGMIATAELVYERHGDGHHCHYDLVLGVPGAMPAWPDSVAFLSSHLPEGSSFSATGIGRHYLKVAEESVARGGHVRTGFEDVRWVEPGRLATSNAELVERVVGVAKRLGREISNPDRARELLGLGSNLHQ